ncbi:MAG: hypothetical protein ABIH37_04050 [archaeon]
MAKYVCKNCNYRFDSEDADECGFCGMKSIEVEKNAEELIDEIERILG